MHSAGHHDAHGKTLRAFGWIGKAYFFAIPLCSIKAGVRYLLVHALRAGQWEKPIHPAMYDALQTAAARFEAFL
jgi:hypothetical protein